MAFKVSSRYHHVIITWWYLDDTLMIPWWYLGRSRYRHGMSGDTVGYRYGIIPLSSRYPQGIVKVSSRYHQGIIKVSSRYAHVMLTASSRYHVDFAIAIANSRYLERTVGIPWRYREGGNKSIYPPVIIPLWSRYPHGTLRPKKKSFPGKLFFFNLMIPWGYLDHNGVITGG